ncbi:zinc-alpha-2-glycoprotein-like isoform X3 [Erythrolamprus reginae]|uniref:zinc-alpha-2-glycoprotein-like isoform X3 n=1 Tax=Erythrolamprus reginae TaxID=121349 RepID=UPI00396CF797
MPLCPACLLTLGATLGVSVPGSCCGSHSLNYFYLRLFEPSQEQPLSFIRGYLNDQPIIRYDSLTGIVEPLVSWMKELKKDTFLSLELVFSSELEKLSRLNHPTDGLPIWQVIWGCQLREDGSKDGIFRYGYNGTDFIKFQKETLRWVAAQPLAQDVKEKWEKDREWSNKNKVYMEEACIHWLKKYKSYRKDSLRKTEPPVGKMTLKVVDESLEVLVCQAYGFYPKDIQATWEHGTSRKNVVPNSDGTYYVWISIEIDPKERNRFRCHLEHDGLQKPLALAWEEKTVWYWRDRIFHQKVRTSTDTEEDKIQLESMLQSEVTMEDKTTCEQQFVEESVPIVRRREGNRQGLQRSLSWVEDLKTLDKNWSNYNQLSWPRS